MFHILTVGSSTGYALFFRILLLPPQTFQFLISRGVLRRTSSGPAEIYIINFHYDAVYSEFLVAYVAFKK